MNKTKTFFSALLLSQVVLNTAAPVLANPYYETNSQNNRRYSNSASTTEKVENNSDWTGLAVLGTLGAIWLWSTFGGDGGGSDYNQQSQDEYYYRDNTSTPSYNSSPSSVKPISPFYGSCHSYDCK